MKSDQQILKDSSAPISALMYVVVKNYKSECFDWEPQVLRDELEKDFDIELTEQQSDKIQAGITVLTTDMYESDIRTFEVCSRLFGGSSQDFEDFEPLEAEELVVGLTEVLLLKMEKLDFSQQVRAYAGQIFYNYGFCNPPKLFADAIMPEGTPTVCEDVEKNEALQELFDEKIATVKSYMDEVSN